MSIGGHQSSKSNTIEWYTPPGIIDALGGTEYFDLDPCTNIPGRCAKYSFTENGLNQEWFGRVWLNPPYGRETKTWIRKLAQHGNGIALIFARTETGIFFPWVWDYADSIYFFKGRLHFHHKDGTRAKHNGGAPSCLIAYGNSNSETIKNLNGFPGKHINLNQNPLLTN